MASLAMAARRALCAVLLLAALSAAASAAAAVDCVATPQDPSCVDFKLPVSAEHGGQEGGAAQWRRLLFGGATAFPP